MPVNFLSKEQEQRYGQYPEELSDRQLARYFHLDDVDVEMVNQRRSDHNRLGFALQLCTVRFLGTFLSNPTDVPPEVIIYLSKQLDIRDHTCLHHYLDRPATHHEHAREIKRYYGYKDFNDQPEYSQLVEWLNTRTWLSDERPSVLFDMATAWLVEHKILLPGVTTLSRLIAQIRDKAVNRLWKLLASIPNAEQRTKLEELLIVPKGDRRSTLDRLRQGPTRISGPSLVRALHRLVDIRSLDVGKLDISHIPPGRFKTLARYAATTWTPTIARMPEDRRIATLFAFAYAFETSALDDALDLLDLLITDIFNTSQNHRPKRTSSNYP
jgi:hypothetical protein